MEKNNNNAYLFLDVDGVLIHYKRDKKGLPVSLDLDPKCVRQLNRVIKKTGAEIVVSSSYRIGRNITQLQELMDGFGVKGIVAGRTGESDTRGLEILEWVEKNRVKVYAVVDDELDGASHVLGHYVETRDTLFGPGLTKTEADSLIEILKGDIDERP